MPFSPFQEAFGRPLWPRHGGVAGEWPRHGSPTPISPVTALSYPAITGVMCACALLACGESDHPAGLANCHHHARTSHGAQTERTRIGARDQTARGNREWQVEPGTTPLYAPRACFCFSLRALRTTTTTTAMAMAITILAMTTTTKTTTVPMTASAQPPGKNGRRCPTRYPRCRRSRSPRYRAIASRSAALARAPTASPSRTPRSPRYR